MNRREELLHWPLAVTQTVALLMVAIGLILTARKRTEIFIADIYSAVHPVLWIALAALALASILAVTHPRTSTTHVGISAGLLIVASLTVANLHLILGFHWLERHDMMTYVGMATDIVNTTTVPSYNFYPLISILAAQISLLTGLSTREVFLFLPTLFYLVSFAGLVLWCRAASGSVRGALRAAILLAAPLYFATFHNLLYHMSASIQLIPLGLYLLWFARGIAKLTLVILLALAMPLFHPITAVFYLVAALALLIPLRRLRLRPSASTAYTTIAIGLVVFAAWYSGQRVIVRDVYNSLQVLTESDVGASVGGHAAGLFSRIPALDAAQLFTFSLLDDALLLVLALIGGRMLWHSRSAPSSQRMLIVAIGTGGFYAAAFLASAIHNPIRFLNLNPMVYVLMPISCLALSAIIANQSRRSRLVAVSIATTMLAVSWLGLYAAPQTYRPTDHVTVSTISAGLWLQEHREGPSSDRQSQSLYFLQTRVSRILDFTHGELGYAGRGEIAYQASSLLGGGPMPQEGLVIVTEYDRVAYEELWAESITIQESEFRLSEFLMNSDIVYDSADAGVVRLR